MTNSLARSTAALTISVAVAAAASGAAQARSAPDHPDRPCFIEQSHWNVALDWPVPRC
ncbi:hypothetical protein GCM10009844_35160 [Nocardioides koreensis]|uniref:Secreted protein n=1 Tax=Nocardioides koreensis TaxID=433651 RepID=A0ABN3A1S6_9ACTN